MKLKKETVRPLETVTETKLLRGLAPLQANQVRLRGVGRAREVPQVSLMHTFAGEIGVTGVLHLPGQVR